MTDYEKSLAESLRGECLESCDALDIVRNRRYDGSLYMGRLIDNYDFKLKYKDGIGYCVLVGERGEFWLREGFPERDRERAKFRILSFEFLTGGFQYEVENRRGMERIWETAYSVRYDSRKAAFEYAIQKHMAARSCLTEDVIAEYTGHMNEWFEQPYWFFNRESAMFEQR
jgi:hypothetical protein